MRTIEELRKARGWTQYQLAKNVGVTRSAVANWERGIAQPKLRQLRSLAFAFGMPMEFIAVNNDDRDVFAVVYCDDEGIDSCPSTGSESLAQRSS